MPELPRPLFRDDRAPAGADELDAWVRQASAGNPFAAVQVALEALVAHPRRHRSLPTARAWLDLACELGNAELRWAVAEICLIDYPEADLEHCRWALTLWARAVTQEHRTRAPGLTVAPAVLGPVFSPDCRLLTQSWSVGVRADRDVGSATAVLEALAGVAARCMHVAEDGQELDDEALDRNYASPDPLLTPSWTSDPQLGEDGLAQIAVDLEGLLSVPAARTLLRIVVEELHAAGVHRAELAETPYHLPRLALRWDEDASAFALP